MKHEWRTQEKLIYQPKGEPVVVELPAFSFFTLMGEGNPNEKPFAECVGVLYSLAYAVKMSPKKGIAPEGFYDYSVYPLEGVWDISEEGKRKFDGTIDKNELVFRLMIRQPDFVDETYALQIIEQTKKSKPHPLLEKVRFETITEGLCVQILHVGSYDNEPASFRKMEEFAENHRLIRTSKIHREIYLTDARKTSAEKLKTILRFNVSPSK